MVTRYQRAKFLEAAPALFAERHTPKTWSSAWPVIIMSGGTLVPSPNAHQFNFYTFRPGRDQPSGDAKEYELRLLAQQDQYASGAEIHALPGVFDYWSNRYVLPQIGGPVHAYIAHHSLHRIVALERLFDLIARTLTDDGHFITCDMIGRNGHMRWPETLRYVEEAWAGLPDVKKFHWQFKQQHETFVNWDCTNGGADWEGIRAQDILPLLIERFSFAAFAAAGGFIDPFVERGYGPNFSADDPADRDFIDRLARRNDELLDAGTIKPTMMFADMMRKGTDVQTKIVGKRSPQFCVRYPD